MLPRVRGTAAITGPVKEAIVKRVVGVLLVLALIQAAGCSTSHEVQVAPVEVKPIHITIDVNVRIERELNDFFSDIDKTEDQIRN